MEKKSPLARQLEAAIRRENVAIRSARSAIVELERKVSQFQKTLDMELKQESSPVGHKARYSPLNEILALLKSRTGGCNLEEIVIYLRKKYGDINQRSIRATMSSLESSKKGPARVFREKSASGEIRWVIAPVKQHDSIAEQANLANAASEEDIMQELKDRQELHEKRMQDYEGEQRASRGEMS